MCVWGPTVRYYKHFYQRLFKYLLQPHIHSQHCRVFNLYDRQFDSTMIQWFTLNTSPLASADTQSQTHTLVCVHIKADLLRSHKWTILSRKYSKYNQGYIEVKLHILHILLYHHIGERTNTHSPPLCLSLSLSHWPSFFWAVCEKKGKREQHIHAHFLWLKHLYNTGTDYRVQPEKHTWTVFMCWGDVMYCTRGCLWMAIFLSLPDGRNLCLYVN